MKKPALLPIICVVGVLAAILVLGGIYLASDDKFAFIKFTLFGNTFSSTSIGVALVFMAAVLVGTIFIRVLNSSDRSGHSGGTGGNAEVDGDGEAQGGDGGSSGRFGPGGNGGHAKVKGTGKAKGGAGGDGG